MGRRNPRTFLEWLGFSPPFHWSNCRVCGQVVGVSVVGLVALLGLSSLALAGRLIAATLAPSLFEGGVDAADIRNMGLGLAALIGFPFLVWRSFVAAKQAGTAQESLLNDKVEAAAQALTARYEVSVEKSDTIENRWEDDVVARVAAIDRLEGLAHERHDLAPRIARLLAAYIRGSFPAEDTEPKLQAGDKAPQARMDLQAALNAIGRVLPIAREIDPGKWFLDLSRCNFSRVQVEYGNFFAARFRASRFEAAEFWKTRFHGCDFSRCLLNYSCFRECEIVGTKFYSSIFDRAGSENPIFANMGAITPGSFMDRCEVRAVCFDGAHFSGLSLNPAEIDLNQIFATEDTEMHEESGLQYWQPYTSTNNIISGLKQGFYRDHDLDRWPYWFNGA